MAENKNQQPNRIDRGTAVTLGSVAGVLIVVVSVTVYLVTAKASAEAKIEANQQAIETLTEAVRDGFAEIREDLRVFRGKD